MKTSLFLFFAISLILFSSAAVKPQSYMVQSPGGHAVVEITIGGAIEYSVRYHTQEVISNSKFDLQFSQFCR